MPQQKTLFRAMVDDLHSLELLDDHFIQLLADLFGHIAQCFADFGIVRKCHTLALGKAFDAFHHYLIQLLANLARAFLHFGIRA